MRILGLDAPFHDPAAALVVDGRVIAGPERLRTIKERPRALMDRRATGPYVDRRATGPYAERTGRGHA
ncbi:hypothetical protein ACGFNV_39780 [Streptomyces sp. NPDC048751]|uniref:hypothetical protein n=1 Tax=Streptomyces sp. NPDC048751 TaxID=3365591 RepID=UPI00371D28B7